MTMNGPFWQEQRRYALQLFKSFAFTEKTLEHHIQVYINTYIHMYQRLRVFGKRRAVNRSLAPITKIICSVKKNKNTIRIIFFLLYGHRLNLKINFVKTGKYIDPLKGAYRRKTL